MKKLLLAVGVVAVIVCVLSLLFAAFSLYGYYHVMDGSASLYDRLHRRMIIFLVIGIVLGVIGTVCFWVRTKL